MHKTTAIFGPPGTGKTRYLTNLVADSLSTVAPDMAVVSFSKAAAREITSRLEGLGHYPHFVGTIHSLCFNTLKLSRVNVALVENFIKAADFLIYSEDEINQAIEMGLLSTRTHTTYEGLFFEANNMVLPLEQASYIYDLYVAWKRNNFLYDFDDMLYRANGKLPKFSVVIVDEAQDLSKVQLDLVTQMVKPGGHLYMAGDDDQAIYTWAGAYPHGMSEMADDKIILDQSFRVPQAVWEVATATSAKIKQREAKSYFPRPERGVVDRVEIYDPHLMAREHLVLVRDRYTMRDIEEELIFQAVPYKLIGPYGQGLFYGPYGKLVRAIKNDDLEVVEKYQSRLTFDARSTFHTGLKGVDWRDIVDMPDDFRHYFERVNYEAPVVTVSTIHAQKGNEANHVVLHTKCSSVVDSLMDIPLSMDNEVRVWYTGITRAKESLTIIGNNQYIGD